MATFVIGHFVLASLPVRQVVIGAIGANGFRILFSVFALATLVWAVRAYAAAPVEELWAQTENLRRIPAMVMPIAPSGTRPISTWRRESVSHASEPSPMPTENTTSSSEATWVSP